MLKRAERLGTGLCRLGLGKGDEVPALLTPGPEFAYLFFAVARLGAVMVPLDAQARRRRLSAASRDADPNVVVAERAMAAAVL